MPTLTGNYTHTAPSLALVRLHVFCGVCGWEQDAPHHWQLTRAQKLECLVRACENPNCTEKLVVRFWEELKQ